jgi:hypothetical protein
VIADLYEIEVIKGLSKRTLETHESISNCKIDWRDLQYSIWDEPNSIISQSLPTRTATAQLMWDIRMVFSSLLEVLMELSNQVSGTC